MSICRLTIQGSTIPPVQTYFWEKTDIGAIGSNYTDRNLLVDLHSSSDQLEREKDGNLLPVQLRTAMIAHKHAQYVPRLWQGQPFDCTENGGDEEDICRNQGVGLDTLGTSTDPFLAELVSGYNTGTIRQFLPRINSTARIEKVQERNFPDQCDRKPGTFFANFEYNYNDSDPDYGSRQYSRLEACMPANLTASPWPTTRDRRDFMEELYLNISHVEEFYTQSERSGSQVNLFKITIDTTTGFFELPNGMNGQRPGPLLDKDPFAEDGVGFLGYMYSGPLDQTLWSRARQRRSTMDADGKTSEASLTVEDGSNRGPLLAIAVALFGSGSFLSDHVNRPEAYVYPKWKSDDDDDIPGYSRFQRCVGEVPFLGMLKSAPNISTHFENVMIKDDVSRCFSSDAHSIEDAGLDGMAFLRWLNWDPKAGEGMADAFTAAAFLANELWLTNYDRDRDLGVASNAGKPVPVPSISRTGVIVISVLIGVQQLALLALVAYSFHIPRWTSHLDAFAMLRIGSSLADKIHFRMVGDQKSMSASKVQSLDKLPGWIGDETHGDGELGKLAMGGGNLQRNRWFAAYDDGCG